VLTTASMHINWKAHAAHDLNFMITGERLYKVIGSHIPWKSCNRPIWETVLDIEML